MRVSGELLNRVYTLAESHRLNQAQRIKAAHVESIGSGAMVNSLTRGGSTNQVLVSVGNADFAGNSNPKSTYKNSLLLNQKETNAVFVSTPEYNTTKSCVYCGYSTLCLTKFEPMNYEVIKEFEDGTVKRTPILNKGL